jgi:hypothetical protein
MEIIQDVLGLILNKLHISTTYRLYHLINVVRKIVNSQIFWKQLIERDLGVVPSFKVDFKLYYLRAMKFPIPSRILKNGEQIETNVTFFNGSDIMGYNDGRVKIFDRYGREHLYKLPEGERIKSVVFDILSVFILTYSGKLYEQPLDPPFIRIPIKGASLIPVKLINSPPGDYRILTVLRNHNSICETERLVLTTNGDIFLTEGEKQSILELPEKILKIVSVQRLCFLALGKSGHLYKLNRNRGRNTIKKVDEKVVWLFDDGTKLSPSGYIQRPYNHAEKHELPVLNIDVYNVLYSDLKMNERTNIVQMDYIGFLGCFLRQVI